jgi:hypothetical protein
VIPLLLARLALAGDVFDEALVELLPLDEITADGARSYDLEILALGPDGTPLQGIELSSGLVVKPGGIVVNPKMVGKPGMVAKISERGGVFGPLTQVEPGHYRMHFTPDAVTTAVIVPITLRGKSADGVKFNRTWQLPVDPVPGFSLRLDASPKELVLGTDVGSVTLSVTLESVSPGLSDGADLQFSASTGEVRDLLNLGDGRWSARLVPPGFVDPAAAAPAKPTTTKPPKPEPPDTAIVAVSDRGTPLLTYGAVAVPLVSRQDVPVTSKLAMVKHGGRVLLDVAGQTYGPVDTNKSGKAIIPAVMIPPGTATAKLTTLTATDQAETDVKLVVPPSRRAWVLVTPASIPADPSLAIPLRVFVVTPDGKPAENAQVAATVTAGQAAAPVHEGGGIYRIDYTPPISSADATATLSVFVDDAVKKKPADTRTLSLVGTRATQVSLASRPGANGLLTVTCNVQAAGVGLDGRTIRLVSAGASRVGDVRDLGGGNYEADFQPTGQGDVLVDAFAVPRAGANAVRNVLLVPDRTRTTNDPLDAVPITVLALDEYGYPVRGAEVLLAVVDGGGKLPAAKVTTDASGTALVAYAPSRLTGLARVRATVKGLGSAEDVETIAILQVPEGATPAMAALPVSGTVEDQALATTWSGLRAQTRITR